MESGKGVMILMSPSKMVDKMKPPSGRNEDEGYADDEEMNGTAYDDAWATFWAGVKSGDRVRCGEYEFEWSNNPVKRIAAKPADGRTRINVGKK